MGERSRVACADQHHLQSHKLFRFRYHRRVDPKEKDHTMECLFPGADWKREAWRTFGGRRIRGHLHQALQPLETRHLPYKDDRSAALSPVRATTAGSGKTGELVHDITCQGRRYNRQGTSRLERRKRLRLHLTHWRCLSQRLSANLWRECAATASW